MEDFCISFARKLELEHQEFLDLPVSIAEDEIATDNLKIKKCLVSRVLLLNFSPSWSEGRSTLIPKPDEDSILPQLH